MKRIFILFAAFSIVLSGWARGSIIFIDEFDADPNHDPWQASTDSGDPDSSWMEGNFGGRTENYGSTSGSATPFAREYVFTTDSDATGDWTGGMTGGATVRQIQFDFYADSNYGNDGPASLKLFFRDTSGQHWFRELGNPGGGWSDDLYIPVAYGSWLSLDGPDAESDWLASLSDVDQVGIYLTYQPSSPIQTYAIDNFMLRNDVTIPEPGAFLFLGVAFVSMGMSFRRKLSDTLTSVLKR